MEEIRQSIDVVRVQMRDEYASMNLQGFPIAARRMPTPARINDENSLPTMTAQDGLPLAFG